MSKRIGTFFAVLVMLGLALRALDLGITTAHAQQAQLAAELAADQAEADQE